jgi:hypothetical protein
MNRAGRGGFSWALLGGAVLFSGACGGSPPPEAGAPAGATAAPPGASAQASAAPAGGKGGAPHGRVLGVAVSDKDDHFTRVTVAFENPTDKPCKVPGYKLTWDGGKKEITLENLTLAPGQRQTRAVRIHKEDGDLTKLTGPDVAHVELHTQCGP